MSANNNQIDRAALLAAIRNDAASRLPFGEPPAALAQLETDIAKGTDDAVEFAAALLANARECEGAQPDVFATCMSEAGRTFERRLRRPIEAWYCYGLSFRPNLENRTALMGLARLSRAARDSSALRRVLARMLDEANTPATAVAIAVEKAAQEIAAAEIGEAIDTLRAGLQKAPNAVALEIMMLGLAFEGDDGEALFEALDALAGRSGAPGLDAAMTTACAALEEGFGRMDGAKTRLLSAVSSGEATLETVWALARIALRSGDGAASRALLELRRRCDGDIAAAFSRLSTAFRACSQPDEGVSEEPEKPALSDPGSPWDLVFLDAVRAGDRAREAEAARAARLFAASPSLAAGLEESARLASPNDDARDLGAPISRPSSRGLAFSRFAAPDDREGEEALAAAYREAPVPALHVALSQGRHELAAEALGAMAEDASMSAAEHEIAAARASVLRSPLDKAGEALEILSAHSSTSAQPPLASLTRLHRREAGALSAVALAEAEVAVGEEARSWCLAWAAHHLISSDPERAEALFREALALNPSCGMALHAVERLSGDHAATARSWSKAAESAASEQAKIDALVKAGVHFALAGDVGCAAESFARGAAIAPSDTELRTAALRLTLAAKRDDAFAQGELPKEDATVDDLVAIAAASAHGAPLVSLRCFELLRERLPDDPVVEAGLEEARLASSRWSEVSGALFERLKAARTPEEEALVYARLAEIDRHFAADPSSAVLSEAAIAQRLPGHRSTLASLAIHYARQNREADLADVLLDLSRVVEDDRDGAAAAATSARLGTSPLPAVRSFAARCPSSLFALAALEAHADDPQERLASLRLLAQMPRAISVHLSRLADALEDLGETEDVLDLRRRALERNPESRLDLFGLARLQRKIGDGVGLLNSMRRMAELTAFPEKRKAHLLEAARVAAEELSDPAQATRLALSVLTQDPRDQEAFELSRNLMASHPDLGFADEVLEARVAGTDDDDEKRALLLEQAEVRERRGDPDGAKASLSRVINLFPGDVETRKSLAARHQRDREWPEAIAQLFEAARHVQDPAVGVGLFYDLGALYQDHGDRPDLAEKCFMKVLGWDRGHFAAMERLSTVYGALQNWPRRAQALEHLLAMTDDPAVRIEKTVALAEVLDGHLNRSREAEQMLNEARRAVPLDVRPVESLAATYSRQHDSLALNVLLDQALATHAIAIGERPGDAVLYRNLLAILTMKAEDDLAAMAEAALSLLGTEIPERYATHRAEPWWNVGARLGDGTAFDFLCPKEVTPGLRETLLAIEEPVSKLLGVSAKHVASSTAAKLDKKHPLAVTIAQYAPSFGVRGEPTVYADDIPEIRVAPGSPPAVLVPRSLASSAEDSAVRFAAAASMSLCKMGLGMATLLPDGALNMVIACCVKLAVPGFELRGVDPGPLARELERLRPAIPHKLIERIHPFAFDCSAALEGANLRDAVRTVGNRAGFIAAGTFTAAVAALRIASGASSAPLGEIPGMGGLASFIFSKVHVELRQRMGI
jgi:tetratricopeptide (TPR) repeat protein